MSLSDYYLGIDKEVTSFYKASASKFYGILFPADTWDDFQDKLSKVKEDYPDASHWCWGGVIGPGQIIEKFNDDGEPSNTAGRPILHALLSSGISQVGCIVVRYFGGKKLGKPGLIEAYGETARLCLTEAKPTKMFFTEVVVCEMDAGKDYLLYNFLARHKEYTYVVSNGQFFITCLQSMTSELRTNLSKIDTLVLA